MPVIFGAISMERRTEYATEDFSQVCLTTILY